MSRDYIDLRDLAKELDDLVDRDDLDADEEERRTMLLDLEQELRGDLHAAANDEPMMVPDDAFEDYARDLAEDCAELPVDLKWPYTCIDWKQAAKELQQDYTSDDFDGETYWRRS